MDDSLHVPLYLGFVSLSTACLLALGGNYWQAGVALLLVGLSVSLGVRQLRNPPVSLDEFIADLKERLEAERPYTAADFPCPDILPGREPLIDSHEPIPFAVVIPRTDESQQLRRIGVQLERWQASHNCVTEIIGLEQLLAGSQPETPHHWFCWPVFFSPSPEVRSTAYTLPIALILVQADAAKVALGDDLLNQLEDRPCDVQSFSYYEYVGR